jgi:hypothetical protein
MAQKIGSLFKIVKPYHIKTHLVYIEIFYLETGYYEDLLEFLHNSRQMPG